MRSNYTIVCTYLHCIDNINVKSWKAFRIHELHLCKCIGVELSAVIYGVLACLWAGCEWLISDYELLMSNFVSFSLSINNKFGFLKVCSHTIQIAISRSAIYKT